MYEGAAVRQFGASGRRGEDAEARQLPLALRIPFIIAAAALCWLTIFAAGYAIF